MRAKACKPIAAKIMGRNFSRSIHNLAVHEMRDRGCKRPVATLRARRMQRLHDMTALDVYWQSALGWELKPTR